MTENNTYTCDECEAEFEIIHDSVSEPEYCPFCSSKLKYSEEEENDDDWE